MKIKSKFPLFIGLFILSLGIIVYLQYVSFSTNKSLIQSNKDLVEEMEFSNNIQFFQTHLILWNDLISKSKSTDIEDLERELKILDLTFNYIKTYISYHHTNQSMLELEPLIEKKLSQSSEIIAELKSKGSISTELDSKIKESLQSNDVIVDKLYDLEDMTEEIVMKKSQRILNSEKLSQNLNLGLALVSFLIIALSVIFIITQFRKQNVLIEKLNTANEREVKLSKIKDDFLANMSHEIRTPLNAILGFTDSLETEVHSAKAKSIIDTIKSAGSQLMFIVNQILDISKIEKGMVKIELLPFDIQELVSKIDASYRTAVESKNLEFKINYPQGSEIKLLGDEYRLLQIVSNLMSNALKFTSRGFIHLDIIVNSLDENTKFVQLKISDSGIGIASDKLDTIFERFEQAESYTTRQYGGTGLGLSIVKQLVNLLDGKIDVSSILDQGSSFEVSIPFRVLDEVHQKSSSSVSKMDIENLSKTKILVVEDNSLNIQLFQNWFEQKNIPFHLAMSGSEAIDTLKTESYDFILMDIQLPNLDGYQCTSTLRNELKVTTPIIAMSAHSQPKDKEKAMEVGMNAYLTKPILKDDLFQLLSHFISIADSKLIDKEKLDTLSSGNDEFTKVFLSEFLKITPMEIEKLKDAFLSQKVEEVRFIAHSLKTNFSYLGAANSDMAFFESLESAEELSSKNLDFYSIIYLFERTKNQVEEFIKNL